MFRHRLAAPRLGAIILSLLGGALLAPPAYAATVYYVATSGSDTAAGSSAAPFKTISKCAAVAVAGDVCTIRAGVYRETVRPAASGTAAAPITFTAAAGAQVTVDGSDPVTGWTAYSGQIYRATVTLPGTLQGQQLFQGATSIPSARWPATGTDLMHPNRATAGSGSGHNPSTGVSTIVDPAVGAGWTGARVTFWGGYQWLAQTGTVTSSSAGQFTFTGGTGQCAASPYDLLCAKVGTRYYLSNTLSALTQAGQWFYDAAASRIYYWAPGGGSPSNVTVKTRNWAFDLTDRSYVTISGISVFGATITTNTVTKTDTANPGLPADCNQLPDLTHAGSHNIIDGVTATYVSQFDRTGECARTDDLPSRLHLADTGIVLQGDYNTVRNSRIAWSAGNGVAVYGTHNTVTNTLIRDVDYMGTYSAGVYVWGQNNTVSHNTIYSTGQAAITGQYFGDYVPTSTSTADYTGNVFSYNDIFDFGLLDQDSGGIYICCMGSGAGGSIDHNWIHDGQQPLVLGQGGYVAQAQSGIYFDIGGQDFTVSRNVVWNLGANAMLVNGRNPGAPGSTPQNIKVYNNTFADTPKSFYAGDSWMPNLTGSVLANNVFTASPQLNGTADPTQTTNLTSATPGLISSTSSDHRLAAGSAAINAGTVIPGVTDGYVGPAPDIGAYEYGGDAWVPGCSFAGCSVPTDSAHSVDDAAATKTGTWSSGTQSIAYGSTVTYSNTVGSTITFSFTGTQARLYALRSNIGGYGAVSVDGGPASLVDFYSYNGVGNNIVYTTPVLTAGTHTISVQVTGLASESSYTYVAVDRVTATTAATAVHIDDATTGIGDQSVLYTGANWYRCLSGCSATYGVSFRGDTVSSSQTAGETATIFFTGTSASLVSLVAAAGQTGATVSVDGGTPTSVTFASASTALQTVYTTPDLPWGHHTLRLNSAGPPGSWAGLDEVVATN